MIDAVTGCELKSNRMARFTHGEGFPDSVALFEVEIKAVKGEDLSFGDGKIEYGAWTDHQPSGASVMHTDAGGNTVTTLGDDLKQEMEFVLVEQYEKKLAAHNVDFKTQTAYLEVLLSIILATTALPVEFIRSHAFPISMALLNPNRAVSLAMSLLIDRGRL